jgi:hypothetical protein
MPAMLLIERSSDQVDAEAARNPDGGQEGQAQLAPLLQGVAGSR